ncbi:hypothetical protein [Sinomonas sp. R1AF57]|uniref:hypothetical protein n=1 Tax=Sinomonas sp. R1AF57 TaxID=2020377 RepID=UPI000B61C77D|nr:hypothetical protein [Sinomonas sp. R1AF57]ASN52926.1 hypothetical protein CGQ25_13180 [Sinomonas sp. R1AF57]
MSVPSQSPSEGRHSQAVLGPFTVRDLTLFGGVLILFVGSLLPLLERTVLLNLWNSQSIFFLAIGFLVPAAAAALFAWRRVEPHRPLRVGSLSVDQFASVAAVLCASYFFVFTVMTLTPGAVVGLLGAAGLLASTTFARLIPAFAADFADRPESPAHIVARDAARPAPKAPHGKSEDRAAREPRASVPAGGAVQAGGAAPAAGGAAAAAAAAGAWGASTAGAWGSHPGEPEGAGEPSPAESPRPAAAWARPAEASSSPSGASSAAGELPEDTPVADDITAGGTDQGPSAGRGTEGGSHAAGARSESDGAAPADVAPAEVAPAEATPTDAPSAGGGDLASRILSTEPQPPTRVSPAVDPTLGGGTYAQADGEAYGAPQPAVAEPVSVEHAAPEPAAPGAAAPGPAAPGPAAPEQAASKAPGAGREPEESVRSAGEPAASAPPTAVFPAWSGQSADEPDRSQGIEASGPYEEPEAQYEAFWFAVSQPRTAVDPTTGQPVFPLEPGQWILALQDRGHEFVVQSTDGRVGVLRDLSGIERG